MGLKESLDERVSAFMTADFVRVSQKTSIADAARAMMRSQAVEAVVTRNSEPIGIITERDVVYKVVAAGKDPAKVTAEDAMSSPVLTIDERAKVGDAIAKMSKDGVRRLGVTKMGKLVGLVTQKSIVSAKSADQVVLPELLKPGRVTCPYCDAVMEDTKELSKHIDGVHLGRGLLQGDVTKW